MLGKLGHAAGVWIPRGCHRCQDPAEPSVRRINQKTDRAGWRDANIPRPALVSAIPKNMGNSSHIGRTGAEFAVAVISSQGFGIEKKRARGEKISDQGFDRGRQGVGRAGSASNQEWRETPPGAVFLRRERDRGEKIKCAK